MRLRGNRALDHFNDDTAHARDKLSSLSSMLRAQNLFLPKIFCILLEGDRRKGKKDAS